ncbi:MAG: Gfo/Idh/MocA family oxidoreductase [Thaumarchaeota archaeon]|nr:MAG: Gfo/Idh/MocA family oxidoreductase [Nitrososphaerota archaeon]
MVRIAVIGIGGWGKNHVRVLNELDALAAVCDANRERMQLYSKKYRVTGYESVDSMVKKEKLDGVTICTPASTHFAIASKVLGESLNTFVEKPMTTTSKDGESLIELAKKAIGAPILLEFHRENRRGDVLDVGIVKDASVHDIDTARWLFGEEPRVVFARVGNVKSDNEDFAAIMLGFGEQRTAFITTNWVTPARVRTLEAVFENGVVNVDFVSQQTQVHEEDGTRMPKLVIQEPLMLELKEYLAAIEEKRQPLVRGEDGLMVTRIAEAVLASSHSGTPIFMKP